MFLISLRCSNWYEGSDVLKAVVLKNTALRDVTPCRMKQGSALGGGKCKEGWDSTVLRNIRLFLPDYGCYVPEGSALHTNV